MRSVDDLWEHIAYVLAYAPSSFPYKDFLSPEQQMTLDLAFDQLRQGVEIAYPEMEFQAKRNDLFGLLARCHALYLRGGDDEAGALLSEFQDRIFRNPCGPLS